MDRLIFLFALFSLSFRAFGDELPKAPLVMTGDKSFYDKRPADIDCVIEAAAKQDVPANVLLALSSIEYGRNGQFVKNTNNTYDIGYFQINSSHWRNDGKRKGIFARYPQITIDDVAHRGCYNAELAAWILNRVINEKNGQDYWTRVANYHSYTPKFNTIYRSKVIVFSRKWSDWLQKRYSNVSVSLK